MNNDKLLNSDSTYRTDVIKEILKSQFANPKMKITDEAVDLIADLAKIITTEAAVRAAKIAEMDNSKTVNLANVECILPQLMLDLP